MMAEESLFHPRVDDMDSRHVFPIGQLRLPSISTFFTKNLAIMSSPSSVLDLRTSRPGSLDHLHSPLTRTVSQDNLSAKENSCCLCDYKTNRRSNLVRHLQTMHQTRVPSTETFECCNIKFASKSDLKEHKKTSHSHGYQCECCSRRFVRRALLKRHMNVHSGVKDYRCHICSYASSHKSNLERHVARLHGTTIREQQVPQTSVKRRRDEAFGEGHSGGLDSGSEDSLPFTKPRLWLPPYKCLSCESVFRSPKEHLDHSKLCTKNATRPTTDIDVQLAALALIELRNAQSPSITSSDVSSQGVEDDDMDRDSDGDHPFLQTI